MTNTEDYQPQGAGFSVDHLYDFCPSEYYQLPVSHPGHNYPALSLQIAQNIRYPRSSNSKSYYLHFPLLGCKTTLGPLAREKRQHRAVIGRFVPKDWEYCRVQYAREQIRQIRHIGQESISRAQANTR